MDRTSGYVIFFNILIFGMQYAASAYFLKPRFSTVKTVLLLAAGIVVTYFVGIMLPYMTILCFLLGEVVFFIPVFICYSDKFLRKLFFHIISVAVMFTSELIVVAIFHTGSQGELDYVVMYSIEIGIMAILYFAIIFSTKKLSKTAVSNLSSSNYISYFFLLVTEAVMILGWINYSVMNLNEGRYGFQYTSPVIITTVMCVVSDIFAAKTIKDTIKAAKAEAENKVLTAQIKAQKDYYEFVNSEYTEIRRLRHDISNHLYTINALLDDGKPELAKKYSDELKAEEYTESKHICSNITADAFLIHKIDALEKENIVVSVNIENAPEKYSVTDTELITIFGNMLDNAAEACRHQEEKIINLSISSSHGFTVIKTDNKLPNSYQKHRHINGLERGIGSAILEELAEKYGGNYTGESKDGIYISCISIPSLSTHI